MTTRRIFGGCRAALAALCCVTVLYAYDRPDAEIVAVKWRLQ